VKGGYTDIYPEPIVGRTIKNDTGSIDRVLSITVIGEETSAEYCHKAAPIG
jgi:hypothetical protein